MQTDRGSHSGAGLSAPPGFNIAYEHVDPSSANAAVNPQGPQRQPQIVPAVPKMPPPGLAPEVTTPEQTPRTPATPGSSDAKKNIKALAAESGLSRAISSHANTPPRGDPLQDEDFPALNAPKATGSKGPQNTSPAPPPVATPKGTPLSKKERMAGRLANNAKAPESPSLEAATPSKRSAKSPAALNTQAAAPPTPGQKTEEMSAGPENPSTASAAYPPLPTPSAGDQSPSAARAAPKTLRVLPTPKAEVPPVGSPVSAVSRAMSVSNIRPETPPSEMVSDTEVSASVSASRAGSPPPTKVGAAAVRATTKSQQRKQRKDALKQDTKLISEAPKPEPEEHAPVVGRKKKQKKEKPPKAASSKSKAAEPALEPDEDNDKSKKLDSAAATEVTEVADAKLANEPEPQKSKDNETISEEGKEVERPKYQVEDIYEPVSQLPQLGPTSVFNDIKNSLWASAIDRLHMLKSVSSGSSRADHGSKSAAVAAAAKGEEPAPCKDCACKCGEIQDADLAELRAGKPVRKQFHVDGSRMLITPNGDCIRGLSAEEEYAFLQLQASIAADAENPGAFVFQRHQPGNGAFSLIKGRAVPNGRPNIFPATSQPQSHDPIGKLQREDALNYINQYVLPRLNLGATNVGWPKGATVRQDAAAASLNSLAPYFYGPDAAAGVGIYSAPDSKDFAPASSAVPPGEDGGKCGGTGVSGMPLMSVDDAEAALGAARKETEKLEKRLNALIKTNKRVLLGTGN